MNTKEFSKKIMRHGELVFKPIDELPVDLTKEYTGKEYIVGHSESGHHHVATADLSVFKQGDRMFLDVQSSGTVKHLKTGKDKHKTLKLFKGFYEVINKFAYNPFKKIREQVRD